MTKDYYARCRDAINQRCTNPNNPSYKDYGARGIYLCEEWKTTPAFRAGVIAEIGDRPPGMEIDRIDNDDGYRPGNIRWATSSQQKYNQRHNQAHPHTNAPLGASGVRWVQLNKHGTFRGSFSYKGKNHSKSGFKTVAEAQWWVFNRRQELGISTVDNPPPTELD